MKLCCAILAGGQGRRIGGHKAMINLDGQPLIAHVARPLNLAGGKLAVIGDPQAANWLKATAIPDPFGFSPGPMTGIIAALDWADQQRADWLVIAPCDTPRLPDSYVSDLLGGVKSGPEHLACLEGPDGAEPLLSIWRPALRNDLARLLSGARHPAARAITDILGAKQVPVLDPGILRNVNTPEELEALKGPN